jgi:hypothetical protein
MVLGFLFLMLCRCSVRTLYVIYIVIDYGRKNTMLRIKIKKDRERIVY